MTSTEYVLQTQGEKEGKRGGRGAWRQITNAGEKHTECRNSILFDVMPKHAAPAVPPHHEDGGIWACRVGEVNVGESDLPPHSLHSSSRGVVRIDGWGPPDRLEDGEAGRLPLGKGGKVGHSLAECSAAVQGQGRWRDGGGRGVGREERGGEGRAVEWSGKEGSAGEGAEWREGRGGERNIGNVKRIGGEGNEEGRGGTGYGMI